MAVNIAVCLGLLRVRIFGLIYSLVRLAAVTLSIYLGF